MNVSIDFNKKREIEALNELAKSKGMSPEALMKQAFRFYQTIEKRVELGQIDRKDVSKLLSDNSHGLCLAHEAP